MGRVLAPYGVRGWIKVEAFTVSPAALLDYDRWWLAAHEGREAWKEFPVVSARLHGGTVLAELSGLADREAAAAWRGALLGVPRRALPPAGKGKVYWADLMGLTVINRGGETLGKVAGLLDTGAHPVLRVATEDGRERLIPLSPVHVDAIEPGAGRIVVDWHADY
ncbi:MAG TPA: ribosome maturation factor RimM [Casimicrobiaceae bacterium]|nr:ribosome maturation factor RimM [Casimicrobiaceae bacterium]